MPSDQSLPFFVSIPHSGERVPSEVTWLSQLSEQTLMRDVDRYVDVLYKPSIDELQIPLVETQWHRYVVDLNRTVDQVDQASVQGATEVVGTHPKGLHWSVTTHKEALISQPMEKELHDKLVQGYYEPFHLAVKELRRQIRTQYPMVYHLDLHSMPSVGTALHPDPGEKRAEVVISDFHGKSSASDFKDLVIKSYQDAGFQVAYNWPYVGGGITQMYGQPDLGFSTVQVELNRAVYMDEDSKQLNSDKLKQVQKSLGQALSLVHKGLKEIVSGKKA